MNKEPYKNKLLKGDIQDKGAFIINVSPKVKRQLKKLKALHVQPIKTGYGIDIPSYIVGENDFNATFTIDPELVKKLQEDIKRQNKPSEDV